MFKNALKSKVCDSTDHRAAQVLSEEGTNGGLGAAGDQIESFYRALEDGLRNLENSLPPDSLSFRFEWLQLAVGFLQRIHLNSFLLIEKLWLLPVPSISSKGPSGYLLDEYLNVSLSLLEMCNNLKDGLNQVDTHHLGLDFALERLSLASENLQQKGHELLEGAAESGDQSQCLDSFNGARHELENLDFSTSGSQMRMWARFLKSSASPGSSGHGSGSDLPKTFSLQPLAASLSNKKKPGGLSLVLYDVQVVTSFVSCVLLWVLTGQSGESRDFSSNIDALEPSSKLQRTTSWPIFMFRLKEKVSEQSFHDLEANAGWLMKLQDVQNFQKCLASLRAELKAGLKEGILAPGTAFSERIKKLFQELKQKLGELSGSLERISLQLDSMFSEIVHRRKKVLDTFEVSLYRQGSVPSSGS